ncbi:phytanoyl-CoA dioxygenase, peroxisomal-like [Varroa destructor]|uniref:phytanoyl-CoA dioxygenase n=1 Tax=Varroa destructor TaxID=109461 RepID=A0A7M7K815_VARDE|nr:phytanoyl-CoA dioxygenase, peroxisomal-like [Varroa destructor]XP_022661776.1 phytanoyl-CoA dioxygenase, peroxisomal-like [Varroa destructor]XP_022661777.1 phytanoyl-CoA dioxygenase, peroxisomal-like [Varroa destructor]XP_022661778.1 phytanoyl-CoA dioxygenase, peroxisomal-like [Varroa destructor]
MSANRLGIIVGHLKGTSTLQVFEDEGVLDVAGSGETAPETKYRFTLDKNNGLLSRAQRTQYEANGFIIVKGIISNEELDHYAKRFDDIVRQRVHVPGLAKVKDVSVKDQESSTFVVNKLQDIFMDDELFAYCRHPKLLDYVENFTGPNIMAVNSMLINKPPDSGSLTSRHPLHQDLHYFPFRPADRVVCAWTAMESMNRDNGCLVVIPGSHKGALLEHDYPDWEGGVNIAYYGVKGACDVTSRRVFLQMDKGDTVFFHPILIHGSGANRSRGFRKAISCHYAASECDYIDVTGTTQVNIAKETMKMARIRGFLLENFEDAYRFRSQLVRGKRLTL